MHGLHIDSKLFILTQEKELITAPLTRGDILAGVTRDSILSIARGWSTGQSHGQEDGYASTELAPITQGVTVVERFLTMAEVVEASEENRVSLVELN